MKKNKGKKKEGDKLTQGLVRKEAVWPDECILMKFMQLRSFWLYIRPEGDCLI